MRSLVPMKFFDWTIKTENLSMNYGLSISSYKNSNDYYKYYLSLYLGIIPYAASGANTVFCCIQ